MKDWKGTDRVMNRIEPNQFTIYTCENKSHKIVPVVCRMAPSCYFCAGELAEWSIAAVLKTVDCNRSGGSNPSLSANFHSMS